MDIFWDIRQEGRIADAQYQAYRADSKSQQMQYYIKALEEKIDEMALKCQALWEIVREATSLSDADIYQKIQEVDLRDGVADGKITPTAEKCKNCGRAVSKRHSRCLYCGRDIEPQEVF
ncbi:MAG: hypothetical protein ACYSSO_11195 [Planctomycetota bacterium]|jgi:ribosomal protein L32